MYKITVKDVNGNVLNTETFTLEDCRNFKTVELLNYEDDFRFIVCDTFGAIRKIADVMSDYIVDKDCHTVRSLAKDIEKLAIIYVNDELHIVEANYGEVIVFGIDYELLLDNRFEVTTSSIYNNIKFEIEKVNN